MKTNIIKTTWNLFLVAVLLTSSVLVNAQDIKLSRRERKEVEKANLEWNFHILDSLLNAKSFVLEADYLQDKYGMRVPVLQSLNFIKVNATNGVLQTGNNYSMGLNGVGGVTAEGSLGSWKISKDFKRMSYVVQFYISTNIGHYDVTLNVNAANNAQATITGLGPGRLTWVGHLVTLDNTRVFKGSITI
jgi:hypothetical protein